MQPLSDLPMCSSLRCGAVGAAAVVAAGPVTDLARAVREGISDDGDAAVVFMGATPE